LFQGRVAQLGERRVRNAEVRGSIPLTSTAVLLKIYTILLLSSSMAEHPAVIHAGILQLPQVTVVEKLGEFRETFSD
jgi:hypothetical protein